VTEILRGGRVFDPLSGDAPRADVAIDGGRITAVGPNLSDGTATQTDIGDMTVVPGLINMHAHLLDTRTWGPKGKQRELSDLYMVVRAVRASLGQLQQGITTVRELGARHHLNVFLKKAVDGRMFPGPRILPVGAPISVTGGKAWGISTQADGPDGMRRAVRETIKAGAVWIKLLSTNEPVERQPNGEYALPEFTPDEYQAAAEAAHMWGRKITAHAMGRQAIDWAIKGGVDSIEHGIYLDDELAEAMVRQNIGLIPTLSSYHQNTLAYWGRGHEAAMTHLVKPNHEVSITTAVKHGVRIAVGTDSIGDYVEELEMLVDCGMTPARALASATLEPARILGWEDRIGTICPGLLADLVVVRGNPLDDLKAMRAIEYVIQAGVRRRPSEIILPTGDETPEWNSLQLLG
jgi:imidazolonepropionase-like amidohydrolase